MAVRLSALHTRRTLLPRNIIIFMFLVPIYARGWVNPRDDWKTFPNENWIKKFLRNVDKNLPDHTSCYFRNSFCFHHWPHGSVGRAMGYGLKGRGSIPGIGILWPTLYRFKWASVAFPQGVKRPGVKLTNNLQLVLRYRMVEPYLHSAYIFMAQCTTHGQLDWVHSVRGSLFGLLYSPGWWMMLSVEWKPKYSNKTCPVTLCPPQILYDLTWAQTRAAAAVGSRRLTAWAFSSQPSLYRLVKATNRLSLLFTD
jgi:hypothetical protein